MSAREGRRNGATPRAAAPGAGSHGGGPSATTSARRRAMSLSERGGVASPGRECRPGQSAIGRGDAPQQGAEPLDAGARVFLRFCRMT